jgi:hypothetical protein
MMKLQLRPISCLSMLLIVPWSLAIAQKETAHVAGTIIDHTSGSVISNADIVQLGVGRRVITDSLGNFQLSDVAPGILRLMVRVSGFPTKVVVLALASGESMLRVIELDSTATGRATAQHLPVEAVVAPRPPTPRYADFERRRINGRGQYLGREDLERGGYSTLQDAMRGLRGVNVECGGGSGCTIRMVRAPMRCTPEYIVDERTDNFFGPNTPIRDLEAIEIYTGPSEVPGEFAGRNAGCGVIVIWTRAGPTRPKP